MYVGIETFRKALEIQGKTNLNIYRVQYWVTGKGLCSSFSIAESIDIATEQAKIDAGENTFLSCELSRKSPTEESSGILITETVVKFGNNTSIGLPGDTVNHLTPYAAIIALQINAYKLPAYRYRLSSPVTDWNKITITTFDPHSEARVVCPQVIQGEIQAVDLLRWLLSL